MIYNNLLHVLYVLVKHLQCTIGLMSINSELEQTERDDISLAVPIVWRTALDNMEIRKDLEIVDYSGNVLHRQTEIWATNEGKTLMNVQLLCGHD